MYQTNVKFKDSEQERRVFRLFYQVLNGELTLEQMTVYDLKNNFNIEDIAVFFELMAKYLDSREYKEEKTEIIK